MTPPLFWRRSPSTRDYLLDRPVPCDRSVVSKYRPNQQDGFATDLCFSFLFLIVSHISLYMLVLSELSSSDGKIARFLISVSSLDVSSVYTHRLFSSPCLVSPVSARCICDLYTDVAAVIIVDWLDEWKAILRTSLQRFFWLFFMGF